jgi:hypothetical protein
VRSLRLLLSAVSVFVCVTETRGAPEAPPAADSLAEALTGGKVTFNLRPRYEFVEQDGKQKDANAFTNRTLLGWRTLPFRGFSVYAEGINVLHVGNQLFNDTPVASPVYPTVADPETTDVNQLYVDYTGIPDTRIRAGRMSLKLDNTRFVGNVEFRQVMQVFNGAMIENHSLANVEVNAAHFERIRNVFDQQRQTRIDLFRAAWTFMPESQLVGFAYFQDQPDTGQATGFADNSNRIVGMRLNGAVPLEGGWKFPYTAEYAMQDDYAGGDARIDADYWRLGLGVQHGKTFVRVDRDTLGSNRGLYGFQTPLGTNHLFQGWVDQFLTTPAQGIHDTYVTAGSTVANVALYAELHDFRSDVGAIHYGQEIDFGATYVFTKQLTGKFEAGVFREDDVLTPASARKRDMTRIWVTMIYSF